MHYNKFPKTAILSKVCQTAICSLDGEPNMRETFSSFRPDFFGTLSFPANLFLTTQPSYLVGCNMPKNCQNATQK